MLAGASGTWTKQAGPLEAGWRALENPGVRALAPCVEQEGWVEEVLDVGPWDLPFERQLRGRKVELFDTVMLAKALPRFSAM